MEQKENEIMAAYTVIFDGLLQLGPGGSGTTRDLLEQIRPFLPPDPRVADFGCGVGASALVLAEALPAARVLALDSHAPFISRLHTMAVERGLDDRISAVAGDMADPPPLDGVNGEFDLIWSESAIYSIGRSHALNKWRALLRSEGWLVFSDIVWQRNPAGRSSDAITFWTSEYPDITTSADITAELAAAGFCPLEPVMCQRNAWSNYYEPLRERLSQLAQSKSRSQALIDVMAEMDREISVYDQAGDEVNIAFFLAQPASTIE